MRTSGIPGSAVVAIAGLLVVLMALLRLGWDRIESNGLFPNIDYNAYHLGGLQVRLGLARHDLYAMPDPARSRIASVVRADAAVLERVNRGLSPARQLPPETSRYIYPPLLAVLVAPLTVLPVTAAGLAWRCILLLAGVAGLVALRGVLVDRFGVPPRLALAAVLACAASWPFLYALRLGQASLLMFASVALAIGALASGRLGRAGMALGVGALIKVTPALVLVLFLAPARRRVLWSALLTIGLGTALTSLFVSPLDFLRFSRPLFADAWQAAATPNNQSLLGMLFHLGLSPAEGASLAAKAMPPPLVETLRMLATAGSATLAALTLAWCLWPARESTRDDADSRPLLLMVAALSIVAVVIAPLSLAHLHAAGLPAYALVLGRELPRAGRSLWRRVSLAALHAAWLVPTAFLPPTLGASWPLRPLYGATLIAASITGALALRMARLPWGPPGAGRAAASTPTPPAP